MYKYVKIVLVILVAHLGTQKCLAQTMETLGETEYKSAFKRYSKPTSLEGDSLAYTSKLMERPYTRPSSKDAESTSFPICSTIGIYGMPIITWDDAALMKTTNLGVQYLTSKDYSLQMSGLQLLSMAESRQYGPALYNLGVAYAMGIGVDQNLKLAFQYFLAAAQKDIPSAQYNVGIAYEFGYGTFQDPIEAIWWYHQAADQGHLLACNKLEKHSIESLEDEYDALGDDM